jgi:hypothetical protein
MKNILKLSAIALFAGALSAEAQVKYKISRSEDLTKYTVSMIPEKTLNQRESIIGTMQVTLKVKSDQKFELARINSADIDTEWQNGAVLRSPDGGNGFDYFSINLRSMGNKAFSFKDGEEVKLFTIENAGSLPEASLELMDNEDNLAKSDKFNVKNHISVLGYGRRNAYAGNTKGNFFEDLGTKLSIEKIYPNPTPAQEVTIEWKNLLEDQSGELMIVISESASGREVIRKSMNTSIGQQALKLATAELEEGTYFVGIVKDGVRIGSNQKLHVVK